MDIGMVLIILLLALAAIAAIADKLKAIRLAKIVKKTGEQAKEIDYTAEELGAAPAVSEEPTEPDIVVEAPKKPIFRFPVAKVGVTGGFVIPDHMGIDFGFFDNQRTAPILSATPGKVTRVWVWSDAGLTVRVKYDDPDGQSTWYAQYKHLSRADVSVGDTVEIGTQIGLMGDSGGYTGQYHLHFDLVCCPRGYNYTQSGTEERRRYSTNPLKHLVLHDEQYVGSLTVVDYNIINGRLVSK